MKTIEVVAAVIVRENEVFCTQRGYGDWKGWWEFHLTMHCFVCRLLSDSLQLKEHEASAWLSASNLKSVKWLPADEGLLEKITVLING